MKRLLVVALLLFSCVLFLCVCLALTDVRGMYTGWNFTFGENDYDPPGATCENAGQSYEGNPFAGWPQQGRSWGDINFYYCAEDYYQIFGRTHWGIDIDATHREPLYATADAVVAWAYEDSNHGMGRNVKICTGGWCATYMHLDEWVVSQGQAVSRGQLLGYADNTGNSTGTHLHYQINHPAGFPVDPAPTMGAAIGGGL